MNAKALLIEWRHPQTPEEKKLYGRCFQSCDVFKIFINNRYSDADQKKTLWHELLHMYFSIYKIKMSVKEEEKLCRKLENIIYEVLR